MSGVVKSSQAVSSGSLVLTALGLGLYWAWRNCVNSFEPSLSWLVASGSSLQKSLPCIGGVLAALVVLTFSGRTTLRARGSAPVILGSLCSVGSLGIALCDDSGVTAVLHVATFAFGFVLLVSYGGATASFPSRDLTLCVAGSFAMGGVCYIVSAVSHLPPAAITAIVCLLPFGSGVLLSLAAAPMRGSACAAEGDGPAFRRALPVMLLLLLVLFTGVEETLRVVFTQVVPQGEGLAGTFTLYTQIGGLIMAGIVMVSVAIARKAPALDAMARVLLPVLVLGFLMLLLLGGQEAALCFVVLGAGYWSLRLFIWVMAVSVSRHVGIDPLRVFAVAEGGIALVVVAAQLLGDGVGCMVSPPAAIAAVGVFIVVTGTMVLLSSHAVKALRAQEGRAEPSGAASREDGLAGRIEYIAHRAGLTPREREVFVLLARGRDIPRIQKQLDIALGTAQAHVRHIYAKLDVHTRQELIDLVDASSCEDAASPADGVKS